MIMPNQQSAARLTCQQQGEFQLIISGDQSNFNSSAERRKTTLMVVFILKEKYILVILLINQPKGNDTCGKRSLNLYSLDHGCEP